MYRIYIFIYIERNWTCKLYNTIFFKKSTKQFDVTPLKFLTQKIKDTDVFEKLGLAFSFASW